MNNPPKPPGPPKFERPSDDWWKELTDEDREWLAEANREGRLAHMTYEWAIAEIETAKKRALERIRRAGFEPDDPNEKP